MSHYQFNMSIVDDKQVSSELKRSLEGKLPEPGRPVSVEILMDTAEVWSDATGHVYNVLQFKQNKCRLYAGIKR